ncbi:hypothetical protein [Maridesulfovibrio bastinii]|uniref:hypothetical protein n=1 Tax=Maridesulfovibrio bastinii TaxID=47157 RepID=UPI000480FC68|nr:hypothetical protein [Maridesulfovibrio bastinii]
MLNLMSSNCVHHEGPLTKEDVHVLIGMALDRADKLFSCEECCHFQSESDEYGSYSFDYCEHPNPKIACCGNLKTFPFKKAPKRCFDIQPWVHAFIIGEITDDGEFGEGGRYKQLRLLSKHYNRFGVPRLNSKNEAMCRKAFSDFCKRTGFDAESSNA